jgi:hypothetical protein
MKELPPEQQILVDFSTDAGVTRGKVFRLKTSKATGVVYVSIRTVGMGRPRIFMRDERHVSYVKKLDPEYSVNVDPLGLGEPTITLHLSKLGGGTVGQEYAGTWAYEVEIDGEVVTSGTDLSSGTHYTHSQMARVLAEFLAGDISLTAHEDRFYVFSDAANDDDWEDDLDEEEDSPPDTARSEAEYDLP